MRTLRNCFKFSATEKPALAGHASGLTPGVRLYYLTVVVPYRLKESPSRR